MPFVVVCHRSEVIDRRQLAGPLTIGRAVECDVAIRDIELSRNHCRIDSEADHWVVTDLGSKNGTLFRDEPIRRHVLSDGDVIQIGRCTLTFHTKAPAAKMIAAAPPPQRPVDPNDAMAGTVSGFVYSGSDSDTINALPPTKPLGADPPRPKPDASAGAPPKNGNDTSYLAEIAPSSWDSIYAGMAERMRPEGPPGIDDDPSPQRPRRAVTPVDLTLQAHSADAGTPPPATAPQLGTDSGNARARPMPIPVPTADSPQDGRSGDGQPDVRRDNRWETEAGSRGSADENADATLDTPRSPAGRPPAGARSSDPQQPSRGMVRRWVRALFGNRKGPRPGR